MTIYLIRHAKVLFEYQEKYNSHEYLSAIKTYDSSDIEKINDAYSNEVQSIIPKDCLILTSSMKRSVETAHQLLPNHEKKEFNELNEILIMPYRTTNKQKPLWKWKIFGRIQWFFGFKRQLRSKDIVIKEISKVLKINEGQKNIAIVGHAFQLRIMMLALKRLGYRIGTSNKLFLMDNLEIVECLKFKQS